MTNDEILDMMHDRGVHGRAISTTLPKLGYGELRQRIKDREFAEIEVDGEEYLQGTGLTIIAKTSKDYGAARLCTQTFVKEMVLNRYDVSMFSLGFLFRTLLRYSKKQDYIPDMLGYRYLAIHDFCFADSNDLYLEGFNKHIVQEFLYEHLDKGGALILAGTSGQSGWSSWWDSNLLKEIEDRNLTATMDEGKLRWKD